jgi:biopolymer transport protein ExbB/biopolymer transport protein TolQ
MKAYSLHQVIEAGGVVLLLLVALSVYSLALIWERWRFIRKTFRDQKRFLDMVRRCLASGDLAELLAQCRTAKGPAPEVLLATLVGPCHKEERRRSSERVLNQYLTKLERGIGSLGTIGSIAPFIGLFGTVLGVMRAFRDLAGTAGAGPGVVAVGISEALITTAAGLFVAIPAIVGYNYFTARIGRFSDELRWTSDEILDHLTEKTAK